MPAAVATAAKAVVGFFTANAVTKVLGALVVNALVSTVTNRLFAPKTIGNSISNMQVTVRSAVEYRKIVYGQAMVSGPVIYTNTDNSKDLWTVVALTGHEIDSFVSIWFDGKEIPVADISWTPGAGGADGTGTGEVSTSDFVGENSTAGAYLRYYLGHPDQAVCGALDTAFTQWGTNNRLRGVSYLVSRLRYNTDTERVWENGPPSNYKALIKGRKIYDPRLDTTNGGSGSHRYSDSATWEWSDNPALCVADYLVNWMGADAATEVDWTSIADAADDCDVTVDIPTASTETRFTCNGALSTGQTHRKNLEALLSSMDGKLSYTGGVWKVRASVWEASSVSIDQDDLAGDVSWRGGAPAEERFNTVRGVYVDPGRAYEVTEFQHVTASEFVTRDNGETLRTDVELPMTNSEYMAQRVAYRILEQGDNQLVATFPLNAVGADIAVGDVFDVTLDELSWSAKTFRCVEWSRSEDGSFRVVGREDQASSYVDPAEGEYTTKTPGGQVTLPSQSAPDPTDLTAEGVPEGIRLSWTNPAARLFEWVYIYDSPDGTWANASLRKIVRENTAEISYPAGTLRYFWIRFIQYDGVFGNRFPDSDTSTIDAVAGVDDVDAIQAATVSDGSFTYPQTTFPAVEAAAFSETLTFTAPARINCRVDVTADIYVEKTGGGGLVNVQSGVYVRALVAGSEVWRKEVNLSNRSSADLNARSVIDVPAGQTIQAQLIIDRNSFGDSGVWQPETFSWENVSFEMRVYRVSTTDAPVTPPDDTTTFTGAMTIPNEGETLLLEQTLQRDNTDRDANLQVALFTNSSLTLETATEAALTEPSGGSYARQSLTDASWSVTDDTGSYVNIDFTPSGASWSNVYGVALVTQASGGTPRILSIIADQDAPVTVADGETYRVSFEATAA